MGVFNGIAKVIHRKWQGCPISDKQSKLNRRLTSAQTVRRRVVTAATRVRFHASECEICGERSATVTAFAAGFVCVRLSSSYAV